MLMPLHAFAVRYQVNPSNLSTPGPNPAVMPQPLSRATTTTKAQLHPQASSR